MHSKPGKLVPFTAVWINRVESVAKFGGGIFVGNGHKRHKNTKRAERYQKFIL